MAKPAVPKEELPVAPHCEPSPLLEDLFGLSHPHLLKPADPLKTPTETGELPPRLPNQDPHRCPGYRAHIPFPHRLYLIAP